MLVVAVYPTSLANTRLRAMQYADHLADADLSLELWSLIAERDVGAWFSADTKARIAILTRSLLRLPTLAAAVRRSSAVIVLREALPFGPPLVERLIARVRPLVWDIDDAVWEDYPSLFVSRLPRFLRKTGGKYERLCALAAEVWAGSAVLADWCRGHGGNVAVIPTVVAVPAIRKRHDNGRVVGWIGSPSTGVFVESILPAIAAIRPTPDVVVVGATIRTPPGMEVRQVPWSPENEEQALERLDVGLYPIDRSHPLANGKCGLKAILYMSRGIPPVVTPTATNAEIVRDGIDGLHAETADDWTADVTRLFEDHDLWERLAASAHNRARAEYSLERWGPVVARRLVSLIEEAR